MANCPRSPLQPAQRSARPAFAGGDRLAQWLQPPGEDRFSRYGDWRRVFACQRLRLGFGLALAYFVLFSGFVAIQEASQGDLWSVRLIKHVATAFLMAVGLWELRRPVGDRQVRSLLWLLSGSISILTNIPHHINVAVPADLPGWTLGFFSIAAVIPFYWRWHLVAHGAAYVYYFGINFLLGQPFFVRGGSVGEQLFNMLWVSLMATLLVALYERLSRIGFETRQQLHLERERADRLLANILPQVIADRLKDSPGGIADFHAEVTVLFADLVGFTTRSAEREPGSIVDELNEIFSAFDELAAYYGLEKIKTIGDAYMAAAGIPQPHVDGSRAAVDMALAMQEVIGRFNQAHPEQAPLAMRIGVNVGPVVAGVIGRNKFAYDLWGDTVNVASRLESQGEPGKIQMTKAVVDRLPSHYSTIHRGSIALKGRGTMAVYWLL